MKKKIKNIRNWKEKKIPKVRHANINFYLHIIFRNENWKTKYQVKKLYVHMVKLNEIFYFKASI